MAANVTTVTLNSVSWRSLANIWACRNRCTLCSRREQKLPMTTHGGVQVLNRGTWEGSGKAPVECRWIDCNKRDLPSRCEVAC
eukprot:6268644-Amphidinium_carterae.1